MTDAPVSAFLDAIEKLPPFDGITFRGLEAGAPEPPPLGVAAGILATSRHARVASENFATDRLLVLLHRTGRDVSPFAEHPDEAEVVVRPGSVWRTLTTVDVPGLPVRVLVLEELDVAQRTPAPTEWGDTLDELRARVARVLAVARAGDPVTVSSPGKFVGPWPAQVPAGW